MTAHVCDGGCKDHADAAREAALAEVEQMLVNRWRHAWAEWERLVDKGEPGNAQAIAWGHQAQALNDAEAVSALRGPGAVESLRRWRSDKIAQGGLL